MTRLKDKLSQAFNSDKHLLLLECGQRAVENMMQLELEKIENEILERKVKLEDLKKKNAQSAAKVREQNAELLGRSI